MRAFSFDSSNRRSIHSTSLALPNGHHRNSDGAIDNAVDESISEKGKLKFVAIWNRTQPG
jgi:hypothetical protein